MEEKLQKKWVGGICLRDGKILLIHRINKERLFNQEYFIFPGKEVDDDESIDDAVNESFRDLGITVERKGVFYSKEDLDVAEYFYLCVYKFGEVTLPEIYEIEDNKQFFTPMWLDLSELDDLMLQPESIKEELLEYTLRQEA